MWTGGAVAEIPSASRLGIRRARASEIVRLGARRRRAPSNRSGVAAKETCPPRVDGTTSRVASPEPFALPDGNTAPDRSRDTRWGWHESSLRATTRGSWFHVEPAPDRTARGESGTVVGAGLTHSDGETRMGATAEESA